MYNNFRVYGTGLLIVMATIVYIGVKFVNKFATIALACVILSIIAVYVGIFVNFNGNDKLEMCILGKRLLKDIEGQDCHKNVSGPLWNLYCGNSTDGEDCEPYFHENKIIKTYGIKGLSSGVFLGKSYKFFFKFAKIIVATCFAYYSLDVTHLLHRLQIRSEII